MEIIDFSGDPAVRKLNNMRRPNFFILGAPKCGTTAMAKWLRDHPRIYLPKVKEPHFFNSDMDYRNIKTEAAYSRLFQGVRPEHLAIGEASVFYLYSRDAVANIEARFDQPKYIVMLRNPVDMAASLHEQLYIAGNEQIEDFAEAWSAQHIRRQGQRISRSCLDARLLLYKEVCALGEQLARLYDRVDAERILPLLFDDLRRHPRLEYIKVLEFLGTSDDGRGSFLAENAAKRPRSRMLHRAIVATAYIRRQLPLAPLGLRLIYRASQANQVTRPRPPIKPALREELVTEFRDDIQQVGSVIGRDLRDWLLR